MNTEAYIRGFVKAANAHGVDAVALAKYASGPSYEDAKALADVDLASLPSSAQEMTIGDYLKRMDEVSPGRGRTITGLALWPSWGSIWSKAKSLQKFLKNMDRRSWDDIQNSSMKKSVLDANYSTTTNILDRIGRETGNAIWDVARARPASPQKEIAKK